MQWFNKKNTQAWTGIRSSGDTTFIVQVSQRANAKPLVNFAKSEKSNIRDASDVKHMAQKYKLKSAPCCFVLDSTDYGLFQVEKPNVPKAEQKQAVRWKLKDMIDYPVEQATVDVIDIPPDPNNVGRQSYVYAFSAKNQLIADLSNGLLQNGVNLQAIDAKVIAQRNIAKLLEQQDRGLAMLSFGRTGGLLTFTSGGELFHARRIEIEGARTSSAFERVALELQRSLDNFERQFPFIAINKLVLAPFAERDEFCEYLRASFYLPVETFELGDIFEFSRDIKLLNLADQSSFLPALGAALREGATA